MLRRAPFALLLCGIIAAVMAGNAHAIDPRKVAIKLAQRAADAFEAGDMEIAAEYYHEAYRNDPKEANYLYGAARAEQAGHLREKAEEHFRAFVALPAADPARVVKARGYLQELVRARADAKAAEAAKAVAAGDRVLAVAAYLEAWRLVPSRHDLLLKAALIEREAANNPSAIEHLQLYLKEAPADAAERPTAVAVLKSLQSPPARAPEPPPAKTAEAAAPASPVPAAGKPAESKPAESKPAENKPAENKPAENKPAENREAAVVPADSRAAAAKGGDARAQPAPGQVVVVAPLRPAEALPAEAPAAAAKVLEPKAPEAKSPEAKAAAAQPPIADYQLRAAKAAEAKARDAERKRREAQAEREAAAEAELQKAEAQKSEAQKPETQKSEAQKTDAQKAEAEKRRHGGSAVTAAKEPKAPNTVSGGRAGMAVLGGLALAGSGFAAYYGSVLLKALDKDLATTNAAGYINGLTRDQAVERLKTVNRLFVGAEIGAGVGLAAIIAAIAWPSSAAVQQTSVTPIPGGAIVSWNTSW